MPPKPDKTQEFYRWVDAEGRLDVVSSLDAVPAAERGRTERVTLNGATSLDVVPGAAERSSWRLEPGSFALGFGAALLLSLLFRLLPNGWRGLTRVAVVVAIGALATGFYLGIVRRATGVAGASALATPGSLIEDAKAAVEKVEASRRRQEEELRKIQAEGR